jgi:hypothetical protein
MPGTWVSKIKSIKLTNYFVILGAWGGEARRRERLYTNTVPVAKINLKDKNMLQIIYRTQVETEKLLN